MALVGISLIIVSVIFFCVWRLSQRHVVSLNPPENPPRPQPPPPPSLAVIEPEGTPSSPTQKVVENGKTSVASAPQIAPEILMPPPPPPPLSGVRRRVGPGAMGPPARPSEDGSATAAKARKPWMPLDSVSGPQGEASVSSATQQVSGAISAPGRGLRLPSLAPPPSFAAASRSSQQARGTLLVPTDRAGAPSGGGGPGMSLAPPPTQTAKPAKPSRKVVLSPGHSPLDWARLSGSRDADLRGLPPGTPYLRVTPSMLRTQTGRKSKDAWTALGGRVYNISPYLPFHPGGEPELLRCAGRDGTALFGEIHPWVNYENMLEACLIGILVQEHEATAATGAGDMDGVD